MITGADLNRLTWENYAAHLTGEMWCERRGIEFKGISDYIISALDNARIKMLAQIEEAKERGEEGILPSALIDALGDAFRLGYETRAQYGDGSNPVTALSEEGLES